MFFWSWGMQFRQTSREKFDKRPNAFAQQGPKKEEKNEIKKKRFSWKCSSELVECSLDNRAEKIFRKKPENFRSLCETNLKQFFFGKKGYSSKHSFGHTENSLDNQLNKNLTKARKLFAQCATKKWNPLRKLILVKMLLWTRGMQSWRPRRKKLSKSGKSLLLRQDLIKKEFFQKCYFSSKFSFGEAECSFDNPIKEIDKEPIIYLINVRYWFRKYNFFPKNYLSSKFPSGEAECNCENPAKNFLPRSQKSFVFCPTLTLEKVTQ